ncbi:MAG: lipid IV(A) 3-deoxy-D-manno-octulosonic acid transferase [Arsenophonus sp.]|nr:MAG: lipid IV(A) 3-deoxy-D-manno-octulosonic acid transferase [Arsenophonus sp.]
MIFFVYQFLIYLIQPFFLLHLFFNGIKFPIYFKRINERYGFYFKKKFYQNGIVIHCVSLGETLSVIPLIKKINYLYPSISIIITTTTPSSSNYITAIFKKKNNIDHIYLPYDLKGAVYRFLNKTNPKLIIIMERELWPNLIYQINKKNIPLILANARLSNKTTKKYKKLANFFKKIIKKITFISAQSMEDKKNFIELGYPKKKICIHGNIKFDISINKDLLKKAKKIKKIWGINRFIWIAGSTHENEEKIILKIHQNLLKYYPKLLLILVPRHPQRFKKVKELIQKKFKLICRSEQKHPSSNTQVVLGDSIGELTLLYGIADLAFIGGSLVNIGGHNPLEAAVHKLPILIGPYNYNFKEICKKLKKNNGLFITYDKYKLMEKIKFFISNKKARIYYGKQAFNTLHNNKGTLKKLLFLIKNYIK